MKLFTSENIQVLGPERRTTRQDSRFCVLRDDHDAFNNLSRHLEAAARTARQERPSCVCQPRPTPRPRHAPSHHFGPTDPGLKLRHCDHSDHGGAVANRAVANRDRNGMKEHGEIEAYVEAENVGWGLLASGVGGGVEVSTEVGCRRRGHPATESVCIITGNHGHRSVVGR